MNHEGDPTVESIAMNNIYQHSRARNKLERQLTGENSLLRVISTDVDDTLYSSGRNVIQTARRTFDWTLRGAVHALSKANIPLIINTGAAVETFGAKVAHNTLKLGAWLGLGRAADVLISDYGTSISVRQSNSHMTEDTAWRTEMENTPLVLGERIITWGNPQAKPLISKRLASVLSDLGIKDNPRSSGSLSVKNKLTVSTDRLRDIVERVQKVFPSGVRVILSESNRGENTDEEFHGDIILIPDGAGKDNAAYHVAEELSEGFSNPIELTHIDDGSGGIFTVPAPDKINLRQLWVRGVKPLVLSTLDEDGHYTNSGPELLAQEASRPFDTSN